LSSKPVKTISFGVNTSKLVSSSTTTKEHALFHIGAMNWIPNEEGIRWFLEKVWPRVIDEIPNIKLYLAGREMPDWLTDLKLKKCCSCRRNPKCIFIYTIKDNFDSSAIFRKWYSY